MGLVDLLHLTLYDGLDCFQWNVLVAQNWWGLRKPGAEFRLDRLRLEVFNRSRFCPSIVMEIAPCLLPDTVQ